ncbi:MAG: acyl-CoA dehydrogenase [Chloroflexi bacterium]|nr:acyl-CoA dehydrogenase [Chloroflexota bacterium]
MDFALTEEQQMFRDMFRSFAQKEIAKVAEHTDKTEQVPPELLSKAAEQGMLGALVPDNFGGAALDPISYALLMEEIGRACLSTAVVVACHTSLVTQAVLDYGDDAQKEHWLPMLASGQSIGAFALTEPDAGSDTHSLATRAKRTDDGYVLNGVKTWVTNAGIAGVFMVVASSDSGANGRGLSAFLVEKDAPGLKVGQRDLTLGLRGTSVHTVYLDNVHVPEANRLGAEGDGQALVEHVLAHYRLALAAAGLGLGAAAVEAGVKFAAERIQFGGPIAKKQAIQNYIADSSAQVEALRYLVYHTAWQAEQGSHLASGAMYAKLFAAQALRFVTDKMVQVHGGYGYIEDYPIARLYRNARGLDLLGGTGELMRVGIATDLFKSQQLEISP